MVNEHLTIIPSYLYHYTSVVVLALILKNHTIRLHPLSGMDDTQEARNADLKRLGDFIFVSSWTENSEESIPMWRLYTNPESGVRIKMKANPFERQGTLISEFANSMKTLLSDNQDSRIKIDTLLDLSVLVREKIMSPQAYSESTSRNVKLFIQRVKADLPFAKFIADEQNRQGKSLSIYALMLLSVLHTERRFTVERIVEKTNLSESKVRTSIEAMAESGLIEASGKGKNRSYILSKKVYKEKNETIQYVRQTDIDSIRYPELVMKLAETQNGIITKQDVSELLKITPSQAYAVIKKLKKEGRLELMQGGKYSKYKTI